MDRKWMVVLVNTIQGHLDDHAMETGLTLLSRAERQSTKTLLAISESLFLEGRGMDWKIVVH